jgi:hypothetical protein
VLEERKKVLRRFNEIGVSFVEVDDVKVAGIHGVEEFPTLAKIL